MNAKLPLVSAIVPVYNGEKYLGDTINSILAQTYTNLECIVVNDGSTDGTATICRSFGERIRYVEKENGGVSSARNAGAREAGGEYVAFLDADDKWLPDKIERQVAVLAPSAAALCLTGVLFIDGEDRVIGSDGVPDKDRLVRNILTLGRETGFIATTGLLRASKLVEMLGFDERLSTSADGDLVLRIAVRNEILALDQPLAMYRHHTGQMHHDLDALSRDSEITIDKFFSDPLIPRSYIGLRRRAIASLEATLAIGSLSQGEIGRSIGHLTRSFAHHPLPLVTKFAVLAWSKVRDLFSSAEF